MEFPYFSPDDVQFIPNHAFSGKQAWKLPIPLGNQYGSPVLFMDHDGKVTLELEDCSGHTFTEADLKQIVWGMQRLNEYYDDWQLQGRWRGQRLPPPISLVWGADDRDSRPYLLTCVGPGVYGEGRKAGLVKALKYQVQQLMQALVQGVPPPAICVYCRRQLDQGESNRVQSHDL